MFLRVGKNGVSGSASKSATILTDGTVRRLERAKAQAGPASTGQCRLHVHSCISLILSQAAAASGVFDFMGGDLRAVAAAWSWGCSVFYSATNVLSF